MANPIYIESAPGVLCGLCIFAGGRLLLGWKMANGDPRGSVVEASLFKQLIDNILRLIDVQSATFFLDIHKNFVISPNLLDDVYPHINLN